MADITSNYLERPAHGGARFFQRLKWKHLCWCAEIWETGSSTDRALKPLDFAALFRELFDVLLIVCFVCLL